MPKEFKFGLKAIATAFVMVVCGTAAVLIAGENRWNQANEILATDHKITLASNERESLSKSQNAQAVFMYQQMLDDLRERARPLEAKQNKTQRERENLSRYREKIRKIEKQQSTLM